MGRPTADEAFVLAGPTAIIANGQSLSGGVALGGQGLLRIHMPSSWAAANLTFQVSLDGTNFIDLYDDSGGEVTVTAAASRAIGLDPAIFGAIEHLKIRSGTAASPVNQSGGKTLTLVTRPLA